MPLIDEGSEQSLHARRERLLLVVVQLAQRNLFIVFWSSDFLQVELNLTWISQINQDSSQSLVSKNGGKELVGLAQLLKHQILELSSAD